MGYCPTLHKNVFEVLVDLLYKIPKACAKNTNPFWHPGEKEKKFNARNVFMSLRGKASFCQCFSLDTRLVHAASILFLKSSGSTASQHRICHPSWIQHPLCHVEPHLKGLIEVYWWIIRFHRVVSPIIQSCHCKQSVLFFAFCQCDHSLHTSWQILRMAHV